MKARIMRHNGKSKIVVPAEVSRYYDDTLMDYVNQVLVPAREIEYDLPAGAKFGGYPVRKDVLVQPRNQNALYRKGFEFKKKEDETAFLREREKIEAEAKRRAAETPKLTEKKAEAKKPKKEEKEPEPVSDLIFGEISTPETSTGTPESKPAVNNVESKTIEGGT